MRFENYIGIDWSGDKNNFQKGISVSLCKNGVDAPIIIKPPEKYWSRYNLINWLNKILAKEKSLVGFDFAFSYPFYDYFSYFPGIKESPTNVKSLWSMIDIINQENENLYGGEIWNQKPYCYFYNAPKLKGKFYITRRRITEIDAKNKIHSPSPTFNCVGPGAVGTGSLAGMRTLNLFNKQVNIWPFDNYKISNKSVFVEIFPTYLAAVCILPEILISKYSIPFYLGGTSLLIVVTVSMDTVSQAQSHLIAHRYSGLIKKSKLRGSRR